VIIPVFQKAVTHAKTQNNVSKHTFVEGVFETACRISAMYKFLLKKLIT